MMFPHSLLTPRKFLLVLEGGSSSHACRRTCKKAPQNGVCPCFEFSVTGLGFKRLIQRLFK